MEEVKAFGNEFDRLRASFNAIRSKGLILTKDQQKEFVSESSALRQRLKQIQSKNSDGRIPPSELARREVLIVNLENSIRESSISNYSNPLSASTNNGQIVTRGYVDIAPEVVNPMELSGNGLMMYSQAKINEQDQIIADIGYGVEKMHQQAKDIGEEANTQNLLLNSLDDNVEAGADALREEAAHAEVVRKKSKVCHLWMCIIVEVIILLILVIIYINHGDK